METITAPLHKPKNQQGLYDMILIYLLNAIGLPPSGSSTVHIYTQTIHRMTQNKQYIEQHKNFGRARAVPRLGGLHPDICLTTEEKARKNLSQGGRRVPAGTSKFTVTLNSPICNMSRISSELRVSSCSPLMFVSLTSSATSIMSRSFNQPLTSSVLQYSS